MIAVWYDVKKFVGLS